MVGREQRIPSGTALLVRDSCSIAHLSQMDGRKVDSYCYRHYFVNDIALRKVIATALITIASSLIAIDHPPMLLGSYVIESSPTCDGSKRNENHFQLVWRWPLARREGVIPKRGHLEEETYPRLSCQDSCCASLARLGSFPQTTKSLF